MEILMAKLTEDHIEKAIEAISDIAENQPDDLILRIKENQPGILHFVMGVDDDEFSEQELDTLLFVVITGIKALHLAAIKQSKPDIEKLEDIESRIFDRWESTKGSTEDKLNAMYDLSKQPELLNLAEDMIMDEEDGFAPQVQIVLFLKAVTVFEGLLLPD